MNINNIASPLVFNMPDAGLLDDISDEQLQLDIQHRLRRLFCPIEGVGFALGVWQR